MKLKHAVIIVSIVLSITLVPIIDILINIWSFSKMGTLGGYIPWIERLDHFNQTTAGGILFLLSIILLIAMIVMIRKTYAGRLNRLLHVAVPIPIALLFYNLLEAQIDVYFREHDYVGFLKLFFQELPWYFIGGYFIWYMIVGLILFLLIMIIFYPIGILIDKFLLYITSKIPKHSQG